MIDKIPEDSSDTFTNKKSTSAIKFIYNYLSLSHLELLLATKNRAVSEVIFEEEHILKALVEKYKDRLVEITIRHISKWFTYKFNNYQLELPLFIILNFFDETRQKKYVDQFFSSALRPENQAIEVAILLWKRFNLEGKNKRFDWVVNTFGVNINYETYTLIGEGLMGRTVNINYPFSSDVSTLQLNGEALKNILIEKLEKDFEDIVQLNPRGREIIEIILGLTKDTTETNTYISLLLWYISKKNRFDYSEWFSGSIEDLLEILNIYKENSVRSEIKSFFQIEVRKSKGQVLEGDKIIEESRLSFKNVIDILNGALHFAQSLDQRSLAQFKTSIHERNTVYEPRALLKEFFTDIKDCTGKSLDEIFRKFKEFNPKAEPLVSISNAILFLKQLKLDKLLTDLQYNELLTKYLFVLTLMLNHNFITEAQKLISDPKLNYRNIAWLLTFIQHVALEETSKLLIEKLGVQSYVFDELKKFIPLDALNSILYTTIDIESDDSIQIALEVRRDLVSEFSGQISDACWAGREEESILFDYQNIETIIIKKGTLFIGSCILIHTVDQNGKPLLILRGINPRETEINQLSVNQFIIGLINFVKRYSSITEEIPLIVIDDHVGGASTNRPKIFWYLSGLKKRLERYTQLAERRDKNDKPTVFNGYQIADNVYSLD